MRMIAGAILILAASVLYSARWLGDVAYNSTAVGTPEAGMMTVVAVGLAAVGVSGMILGLLRSDDPRTQSQHERPG